ncbi:cold-shock protein [Glycomyces paridis]|uniref:Cold-shock protein n=1 Tax=Glycomyces paridis TaxID=2126555 RepID=A0A4S8PEG9_9ACTN|nr:cold-shock protein [Glycomyces paridis]
MQGTIATFNEDRSGVIVLDGTDNAGRRIAFDAAAFDVSGLRLLRPGQRVAFECDEAGAVVAVRIVTMHA